MIGAIVEMNRRGRITHVYICGRDDAEVETVKAAIARIIRPGCWAWLRRLLFRRV